MSGADVSGLVPSGTPAALQPLRELPLPAAVSYVPQTIGWLVVAALLIALLLAVAWRAWRRYERARYRREALVELERIEANLHDDATRAAALAAIGVLIKRTALAGAPRDQVASLSGAAWLDYLNHHGPFDDESGALLYTASYAPPARVATISAQQAQRLARAARGWIERHHVEV